MPTIAHPTRSIPIAFLLVAVAGCGGADDRLVELSERSLARQAEQNQQMARQSTEVAKATRQLVEADAKARQELIMAQTQLQSDLHTERTSLDRQHETLEGERKDLAAQRHQEPIVAAAIVQAATLLACVLPIVLCFFILSALRRETTDGVLEDLLILELTDPRSQLLLERSLPSAPSLPNSSQLPSLPHDINE
jgi:hypothetical protein